MYKYAIESESGFPIVTITYTNAFNNVIEVKRPYTHMDDADKYVQGHMRNWLGDKLTRYIKHKAVLFETGDGGYYRNPVRCDALENCKRFQPYIGLSKLMRLSQWILENEKQITMILPNTKNSSYTSSYRNLQELIWVSVQLRKIQRHEKQSA